MHTDTKREREREKERERAALRHTTKWSTVK